MIRTQSTHNIVLRNIFVFLFILIASILFIQGGTSLLNNSMPHIQKIIQLKWDYAQLRHSNRLAHIAITASNIIPTDACVTSSLIQKSSILETVLFKYYLFPVKIKDDWETGFNKFPPPCQGAYYIDLNQSIKNIPKHWHVFNLPFNARILSIDPILAVHSPSKPLNKTGVFLLFLIFNVAIFASGIFFFFTLYPQADFSKVTSLFPTFFLTGFIGITCLFWGLTSIGISLERWLIWGIVIITSCLGILKMQTKKISWRSFFTLSEAMIPNRLLDILGLAFLLFFVLYIISYPIGITDELNIWLLKAKMFFFNKGIILDYTQLNTNYYPILWPLNIALQYLFIGGIYDEVAKWTSAIMFLCLAGQLRLLTTMLGIGQKCFWLVIIVFIVFFHHWTFFTALPENAYIALTAFAVSFFMHWMDARSKGALYLTALALVGISVLKFEGFLVTLFILISYSLSQCLFKPHIFLRIRELILLSVGILVYIIWLLWLQISNIPYEIFHLQNKVSLDNVATLFLMIIALFSQQQANFIILLIGITLILKLKKIDFNSHFVFLLIFIGLLLTFSLLAGICWLPQDFNLYYSEVLIRLSSRAMPFLALLWISLLCSRRSR